MIVYRLGSARYLANDGLGASLYGGRWNHKGTPVIYTAASRALCALEVLANADELGADYVITPIELSDDLPVTALSIDTRDIGTEWAKSRTTVALVVAGG
jgi:RES domain-containing protein